MHPLGGFNSRFLQINLSFDQYSHNELRSQSTFSFNGLKGHDQLGPDMGIYKLISIVLSVSQTNDLIL